MYTISSWFPLLKDSAYYCEYWHTHNWWHIPFLKVGFLLIIQLSLKDFNWTGLSRWSCYRCSCSSSVLFFMKPTYKFEICVIRFVKCMLRATNFQSWAKPLCCMMDSKRRNLFMERRLWSWKRIGSCSDFSKWNLKEDTVIRLVDATKSGNPEQKRSARATISFA